MGRGDGAAGGPVCYAGKRVALLTQHGKQQVLVPVLESALGCRVEHVMGYDTDRLGTFTRDITRAGWGGARKCSPRHDTGRSANRTCQRGIVRAASDDRVVTLERGGPDLDR